MPHVLVTRARLAGRSYKGKWGNMDFDSFMVAEGRPLPVFLLVDTSGSMRGRKIETVNVALKEMIASFRKIENPRGIIELCIIGFGKDGVKVIKDLSKIAPDEVFQLTAGGDTPMGGAFDKVSEMIEDYQVVSSRAYTPTIVLISDGNPTDYRVYGMEASRIKQWKSMEKIHNGKRSSKAVRLAMGIGDDRNHEVLKAFVDNPEIPVISATDDGTIAKFFQWVTMSVSVKSTSANPNAVVTVNPATLFDDKEVEF